jgi:hypothetical protein
MVYKQLPRRVLDKEGKLVEGFFRGRDKTNSAVLDHLRERLKLQKNSSKPWVKEKYNSLSYDSIDRLIESLKLRYK